MAIKPITERIGEMKKIYTELEKLGLGPHIEEVREFQMVCNEYVRTGHGVSGSIHIPSLDRTVVYHFPASPYQKCVARLAATHQRSSS
jgi:hypothetical protein